MYFISQYSPPTFSTQVSRFVYLKSEKHVVPPHLCFPVVGEISLFLFVFLGGKVYNLNYLRSFRPHQNLSLAAGPGCCKHPALQHIVKQFQMQSHIKNTATLAGKQASEQANRRRKNIHVLVSFHK